jgi:hypothetical protein
MALEKVAADPIEPSVPIAAIAVTARNRRRVDVLLQLVLPKRALVAVRRRTLIAIPHPSAPPRESRSMEEHRKAYGLGGDATYLTLLGKLMSCSVSALKEHEASPGNCC